MPRLFILLIVVVSLPNLVWGAPSLRASNDRDAIAHVVASFGQKDIAEAWLIGPTQRYPHYVRGEQFEASGLRVRLADGNYASLNLEPSQVFEDRTARLADLDGDGRDEIILVLTSLQQGASLAAYSVENSELVLKAKTPFIGRSFRWLNPAGIADYNGDGRLDIALVQKPHLSKRLEFWTLTDGEFALIGALDDVSNHHNGSTQTSLSASTDFDGNGIVDLAILSGDYSTLRLLKFLAGHVREIASFSLPAQGNGNFVLRPGQLLVPMENGEDFELTF